MLPTMASAPVVLMDSCVVLHALINRQAPRAKGARALFM
jgi:hypothetical protein